MSGHNPPHGRLGQPNPTWNPLQVPSYIPRQPQLAHMSSERSLARSPLTWHTPPTHPDQLYSFMTGNHKNNLEMNPILQGYGRNAGMPLGSVDLSLSSASRSTPSPKGNVPVASPVTAQPVSSTLPPNIPSGLLPMAGDQTEQYLAKMATGSMNTNHTRSQSTNPSGGVIQSTAALKDRTHNLMGSGGPPGPGNFLNSTNSFPLLGNAGGNGFGSNAASRTTCDLAAYVSSGLLIKDAKQINNEIGSKNGRECLPSLNVESSDLVKDILMQTMQSNAVSISPKRSSPLRTTILPSQSPGRSRSPPTDMMLTATDQPSSACVNSSSFQELSSAPLAVPHTGDPMGKEPTVGNMPVASGLLGAETVASEPLTAVSTSGAANPASPTNQSITSNEDSVDSNSSKSRRRRKPERTNKMNTEELDQVEDFFTGKNDAIDGLVEPLRPNIAVRSDITALALEGISALSQGFPGIQSDGSQSPHITDLSDSTRVNLHQQSHSDSDPSTTRAPPVATQPGPVGADDVADSIIADGLSVTAATVVAAIESVRKESESNSDDCETIDKIAAMISSTENDGTTAAGLRQPEAKDQTASDTSEVQCNGPLPEHPDPGSNAGKTNKVADPESSYEEIENKLEEMFAGIEEPPGNSKPSAEKGNDPVTLAPLENHSLAAQDILHELAGEKAGGPCENAIAVAGSTGKKPLTPAQKRGNGTKPASAGTPPKRKKVLKKKPAGMSKPLFMDHGLPMGGGPGGSGKKSNVKNAGKKSSGPNAGGKSKNKPNDTSVGLACGSTVDPNGKLKGPYVHIMADGSHSVINTPINEEDAEKAQNKPKKFANNSLANSERSKIRGLHVSTLSTKYDADTTDTSWMCVFCKTGPHRFRLGDLYGPYIISTESVEFEESRVDANFFSTKRTRDSLVSRIAKETRAEQQKQQLLDGVPPKNKKRKNAIISGAVMAGGLGPAPGTLAIAGPSGNQKRQTAGQHQHHPLVDIFYGMTKVSDNSYEVWMHEDCLSWAPGVYVIGTRIVGLEAAIWNCCRHQCRLCSQYGAMLSCLHRGCTAEAHIVCARKNNWKTTAEFQSLCEQHAANAPAQPAPKPEQKSTGKGAELRAGHGAAIGAPSS